MLNRFRWQYQIELVGLGEILSSLNSISVNDDSMNKISSNIMNFSCVVGFK